jgi:MerR family transcriptional regulator/heat shock protein HspR
MQIDENMPAYPMGVAARLLGVHPRTLRIYEEEGFIKPCRHGGKRFFSQSDLEWIKCLRSLIHEDNISIEGVKRLLEVMPCWQLKNCPEEKRQRCSARRRMNKKCWEFTRKTCEKSCRNCEKYLKDNE